MTVDVAQTTRRLTLPLLVVFAVLVCLRMPEIILKGRFWAEEGRYFFFDAWTMAPSKALFFTVGGYLNLLANAATLGARWLMPLELAPYFTIAVALSVQLLPPMLLLTARDGWLRPPAVRIAAMAMLLFTTSSDEIWLQTLHCQFELTLCCALILSLAPCSGRAAIVRLSILLLAPLCGPGAIVLLPLFTLRLAFDRTRYRLGLLLSLGIGSAIQNLLFMSPTGDRNFALHVSSFFSILTVKHLALPFLGNRCAESIALSLRHAVLAQQLPIVAIVLPMLLIGSAFWAAARSPACRPAFWLLASAMLLAFVSYVGAIGSPTDLIDTRFGERYAFVPQVLFGMTLLVLAATSTRAVAATVWLLVMWQLVVGFTTFERPWVLLADGPGWRHQVAAWRTDPTAKLLIWPTGWTMTLPMAH